MSYISQLSWPVIETLLGSKGGANHLVLATFSSNTQVLSILKDIVSSRNEKGTNVFRREEYYILYSDMIF